MLIYIDDKYADIWVPMKKAVFRKKRE